MATPYPQPNAPQQPPAHQYAQQPYPQQPYPQGYYAPQPQPRRPWSLLAISGFVASLVGLGIIGLPVSIAGVVVTQKKPWLRGSGLAIIGIVLGLFWAWINVQAIASILGYSGM